jgi:hypothetical protein
VTTVTVTRNYRDRDYRDRDRDYCASDYCDCGRRGGRNYRDSGYRDYNLSAVNPITGRPQPLLIDRMPAPKSYPTPESRIA